MVDFGGVGDNRFHDTISFGWECHLVQLHGLIAHGKAFPTRLGNKHLRGNVVEYEMKVFLYIIIIYYNAFNFSEVGIWIQRFAFNKKHLKMFL